MKKAHNAATDARHEFRNGHGDALGRNRLICVPQDGAKTYQEALSMLPSEVKLYEDTHARRWQAFYKSVGGCSRAWQLYGFELSLKLVIQWAWREVLFRAGLEEDSCPIRNLFTEALARAAAAASSSSSAPAH